MPSSERTKYLFEYSTECFEQWAVDVVGIKIKLLSKAAIMPQQSHMPQLAYGSTSGSMPFGANLYGGDAFGGNQLNQAWELVSNKAHACPSCPNGPKVHVCAIPTSVSTTLKVEVMIRHTVCNSLYIYGGHSMIYKKLQP